MKKAKAKRKYTIDPWNKFMRKVIKGAKVLFSPAFKKQEYKMVVKKESNAPKEVGLKDVKKDMLKLIDSVDALEQKIVNVSHRVKKLEARVGIPV